MFYIQPCITNHGDERKCVDSLFVTRQGSTSGHSNNTRQQQIKNKHWLDMTHKIEK